MSADEKAESRENYFKNLEQKLLAAESRVEGLKILNAAFGPIRDKIAFAEFLSVPVGMHLSARIIVRTTGAALNQKAILRG